MLSRAINKLSLSTGRRYASTSVGFIGLGNMGGPMALNLLKAGYAVNVNDVSAVNVEVLTKAGAKSFKTPLEIAKASNVIFTMLPNGDIVRNVYTNESTGLIKGMQKGSLLVDCSTVDPETSRSMSAAVSVAGGSFCDAPVSGGTNGAAVGTLAFMVGGSPADYTRVKPFLEKMGKNIFHCGAAGSGEVAKLCNNLVLGISMAAVSEAMNMGVKMGLDPKQLALVINSSSGRCWSSDTYNPTPGVLPNVPSSRGYTGGFASALMLKDMKLAKEALTHSDSPSLMTTQALQIYEHMVKNKDGEKDFSYVYQLLSKHNKSFKP